MKRYLLPAALLLALACLLTGCGLAESDRYVANVYVFKNRTADPVTLEAYDGDKVRHTWTIASGGSLRQWAADDEYRSEASLASGAVDLYTHTSVFDFSTARMVFGGTRELWFRDDDGLIPHNIYRAHNYRCGSAGENELEWVYDIDDDVLSTATAIEPQPAPER